MVVAGKDATPVTLAVGVVVLSLTYNEPRLVAISLVVASTFVFSGLVIQHQAILRRQLRFGALALIQLSSMVLSLITAIWVFPESVDTELDTVLEVEALGRTTKQVHKEVQDNDRIYAGHQRKERPRDYSGSWHPQRHKLPMAQAIGDYLIKSG